MKAGWYYKHGTATHYFKKGAAVSVCGMMKREGTKHDYNREPYYFLFDDCTRCWAKREGRK